MTIDNLTKVWYNSVGKSSEEVSWMYYIYLMDRFARGSIFRYGNIQEANEAAFKSFSMGFDVEVRDRVGLLFSFFRLV